MSGSRRQTWSGCGVGVAIGLRTYSERDLRLTVRDLGLTVRDVGLTVRDVGAGLGAGMGVGAGVCAGVGGVG